jgi:hypothetical protein
MTRLNNKTKYLLQNKHHYTKKVLFLLIIVTSLLPLSAASKKGLSGMNGSSYYKVHPMFHPYPDEKAKLQSIDRFGPVGIGIELLQPVLTISSVAEMVPGTTPLIGTPRTLKRS